MKTNSVLRLAALAVLAAALPASASQVREIGVGVALGEPIGGSAKLWLDDRSSQ